MAQPAARVTDNSVGIPHCHSVHPWSPVPHPLMGPIIAGSTDVIIEGKPSARLGDSGVHGSAFCLCGPNTYVTASASGTVKVNDIPVCRLGDSTLHCATSSGSIVVGAATVLIG